MDFNFLPPPPPTEIFTYLTGVQLALVSLNRLSQARQKTQSCDRFVRTSLSEIMRFETFFGTTANLSSLCHVSADSEEQLPFISDILQMIILLVLPF